MHAMQKGLVGVIVTSAALVFVGAIVVGLI